MRPAVTLHCTLLLLVVRSVFELAHPSVHQRHDHADRGIFASGNYPIAEVLYDKAIKVLPDAVLYANRSAARLNLNMVRPCPCDDYASPLDHGRACKGL